MSLEAVFSDAGQAEEWAEMPILRALRRRYAQEQPFQGEKVVFGHILVRNALCVIECLHAGGAEVLLTEAHPSPADADVRALLGKHQVPILPLTEAVRLADLYLDVGAVLGRLRRPRAAAEVTRTGIRHYRSIRCPVVSADDCRSKLIEGFFGTGDSFLRAWRLLRPYDPLAGKRLTMFGYGKIGRGVAHTLRRSGVQTTVVEINPAARTRAQVEGFAVCESTPSKELKRLLQTSDVVVALTGIPGVLGRTLSPDWFRAGGAILVNLGAEDEFGPAFADQEILGGRGIPLNFHLPQPTRNRYIDAPLAAHLLALEAYLTDPEAHPPGIHPLPAAMDRWVLTTWRQAWPDEDLTGIGADLGLEAAGEPPHV